MSLFQRLLIWAYRKWGPEPEVVFMSVDMEVWNAIREKEYTEDVIGQRTDH